MKEVSLTQGKVAIIDDDDLAIISKYKWHADKSRNTFYARTNETVAPRKQKPIKMHRLIMNAKHQETIDHINGDGLDNRRENLRLVHPVQNSQNKRKPRNSKSKYKGVSHSGPSFFRAVIKVGDRNRHIGCFSSEIEAAAAYDQAASHFFGEFARLNKALFPEDSR